MDAGLRFTAVILGVIFALTACGGGGGHSLPGVAGGAGGSSGGGSSATQGNGNVAFTISIPRASASSRLRAPATISAATQSLAVTVNGATPAQTFNIAAPACNTTSSPIVCTFNVGAPYGLDSFLIETFSGSNATGTALNAAATSLNVTPAGPNQASATAGSILTVTNAADSGGSCGITGPASGCTLREAIIEASTDAGDNKGDPKYTNAIVFRGVSNITLSSPITISGNVVIIGPGASAPNVTGIGAPPASSTLVISGGNATGILILNNGNFAVSGLTFSGGNNTTGDEEGAAIENQGATLSIVNTVFSSNTSSFSGGAVYDDSPSTVGATLGSTIIASTFTGNTAEEGGAYFVEDNSGGAAFSRCLFTANNAFNGSDYGEGGAIFAGWNLSVDSSTFTANTAGVAPGSEGFGGAISIEDDTISPSITNSTFGGSSASNGNVAGASGGESDGEGGAIYDDGGNVLTLAGNTFNNNKAVGSFAAGGAVRTYDVVNAKGDVYSNSIADATSGFEANGGAFYADNSVTLTNESFSANVAKGGSGGEAFGGGAKIDGQLTATNLSVTNNTASAPGEGFIEGGGLYVESYFTGTNVTVSGNQATTGGDGEARGGGAYTDSSILGLTTATFSSNTASAGSASLYGDAEGGGLFVDPPGLSSAKSAKKLSRRAAQPNVAARLARRNSLHAKHVARRAAALATRRKHTRRTHAGKVKQARTVRSASGTQSTRRRASESSASWTGLTFNGNVANAGGGGGFAQAGGLYNDDSNPTVSGTFTNNSALASGVDAEAHGGGIFNDFEITFSGTISGNISSIDGGGFYNDDTATIRNSTISGNTVTAAPTSFDGGGGIFEDGCGLTLDKSLVSGNSVGGSAAGSGGGGLFVECVATVTNSTFFANTSSQNGGGIENQDQLTLVNATLVNNTAAVSGGNIDNPDTAMIQNSIVAGGGAPTGPEINNTSVLTSNGYNLVQGATVGFTATKTDMTGMNPKLASSLANNGGPTQTLAESSNSPGRASIPYDSTNGCAGLTFPGITTDQRSRARGTTTSGFCDIGAYEFP